MSRGSFRRLGMALAVVFAFAAWCVAGASADTRQIPAAGTSSPQTGDFVPSIDGLLGFPEFPGQLDNEPATAPYNGIVDRSLSTGVGPGVSVNSGHKAKSNPELKSSFEGLNHFQQRYSRGGNQFSVEPPDQGLCAGNGFE